MRTVISLKSIALLVGLFIHGVFVFLLKLEPNIFLKPNIILTLSDLRPVVFKQRKIEKKMIKQK